MGVGRGCGGDGRGGPAEPRVGCLGVTAPRGASGKRPRAPHPRPAADRGRSPAANRGRRMWKSGGGGGGGGRAEPQQLSASLTPRRGERDRMGEAGRVASRESVARRPPPTLSSASPLSSSSLPLWVELPALSSARH